MPCKMVFFYNQVGRGWTEVYYTTEDNPQSAATAMGDQTLGKFIYPRHRLTYLVGIRASLVDSPRSSYFRPLEGYKGKAGTSSGNATPDVVSVDAVVKLTSDIASVSRRVFFRGLADEDVGRHADGPDAPSGNLIAGLKSWHGALRTLNYQVRYVTQPPAGGLVWTRILSATASSLGPGFTDLLVTAIPAGLLSGQRIRFTGLNTSDLPGLPRTAYVVQTSVAAGAIVTIPYRFRNTGVVTTPKAFFTRLAYQYTNIFGQQFERFSEHKTGRPTVSLRGRSRVRVRAQ